MARPDVRRVSGLVGEPPVTLVTVESIRDHTNNDSIVHAAGSTYQVPADQLESLRVQWMAVTPDKAAAYRAQLQANEDWYANEAAATIPPVLSALVPASARLGDPNFTLHVQGSGFRTGAVILWNGLPEPTTVVSATEVTTGVNMATAEVVMAIPVVVQIASGDVSNTLTFDLQPAGPPAAGRR